MKIRTNARILMSLALACLFASPCATGRAQSVITPMMTSNTTPAPFSITTTSEYPGGGYSGYSAFNRSFSDYGWVTAPGSFAAPDYTGSQSMTIYLGSRYTISKYSLFKSSDMYLSPVDWNVSVSDDGKSFKVVDTQTGMGPNLLCTFTIPTPKPGSYVRITITRARKDIAGLGEIFFYSTTDNATFIAQAVPSIMLPGQTSTVSVTLQNTGTTTWMGNPTWDGVSAPKPYRLGTKNANNWGIAPGGGSAGSNTARVDVNAPVAPGQLQTFTFHITAPTTPGTYDFQWQMVQEQAEWFGAASPKVSIVVKNPVNINVSEEDPGELGYYIDWDALLGALENLFGVDNLDGGDLDGGGFGGDGDNIYGAINSKKSKGGGNPGNGGNNGGGNNGGENPATGDVEADPKEACQCGEYCYDGCDCGCEDDAKCECVYGGKGCYGDCGDDCDCADMCSCVDGDPDCYLECGNCGCAYEGDCYCYDESDDCGGTSLGCGGGCECERHDGGYYSYDCDCGDYCRDDCDCGCEEGCAECEVDGDPCDGSCEGCDCTCACEEGDICNGECGGCECPEDEGGKCDACGNDCDCEECTCCEQEGEGTNPFTLDGNVSREVADLRMTGSEPLAWIRYNNSKPRGITSVFGQGASWRHNWQYELKAISSGKSEMLRFITPSGMRRSFRQQKDGAFTTTSERYPEKACIAGNCIEITTSEENTLLFEPVDTADTSKQATDKIYRVVTLTNKDGLVTHFDYDSNGLLQHITNEADNQITIYYEQFGGQPCISRVETNDGRAVDYEYKNISNSGFQSVVVSGTGSLPVSSVSAGSQPANPSKSRQYSTLARVYYGDDTSAEYRYAFITKGHAPLLVEADDPRYEGRAKLIGYRYQKGKKYAHGTIHEEYNPVTGQAYASLEFDTFDTEKRTVSYTDDRIITYRVPKTTNGRPIERVDSIGRKSAWSYSNEGAGSLVEKTLADGTNVKYTRDNKGRVIGKVHNNGLVVDTERDNNGKVVKTKDNRGHSSEYIRDSKGRVTKITKTNSGNPDGNNGGSNSANSGNGNTSPSSGNPHGTPPGQAKKEAFSYDAAGRLLRQDFDDGTFEEFTRDNKGNALAKRDRKGGIHQYTYAQRGLVASETGPADQTTSYTYNTHGQLASRTDALGHVTTWERNERGLVTKQTNPDGTTHLFAYDKYGRKISETDELNRTASWEYDRLGRLTRQNNFAGDLTRFDYTETPGGCSTCSLVSNPTRIEHPDGRIDEMLYDSEGRMLMKAVAVGTAQMAVTLFSYDEADNLVQQTNPDGGVIRNTYDIDKNRLTTTDALGRTTTWTYDFDGNILSKTDPSGRTTDYAYDADNNLIYTVAPDGTETTFEYDAAKRRTSNTDALGNTTLWNYNGVGNLASVIDAAGGKTDYIYDKANRLTRTKLPDNTTQTRTYNALGQPAQTTTPDGLETTNEYDVMGRVIAVISKPVSGHPTSNLSYTYDEAGRRTSMTDALNRTTTFEYNARNQITDVTYPDGTRLQNEYDGNSGRLISTIDQIGHATRYTYSARGDIATLTDANGNTYIFDYDTMRRKTAVTYPDDTKEQWTYNLGGRLATHTTRAGQVKTITYNLDGKPLTETWQPAGCAPDVTYTYDETTGRLASIDNGNTLLTYTYDKLGRVTSETTTINSLLVNVPPHIVTYRYDALGRKAGLTYPDGTQVTYTYDAQGRITEVYNGSNKPLATYAYDAFGRRSKLTRDNGVVTSYTYDAASQMLAINHLDKSNKTLAFATYQYNNMGRRTSMTRENLQTDYYRYDATGQLTGVEYGVGGDTQTPTGNNGNGKGNNGKGNGSGTGSLPVSGMGSLPMSESFTYDPLGNRIEHATIAPDSTPELEQYETNELNQYTNITQSGSAEIPLGTTPQTHDANGNLTDDGKQIYRYDAQNRLIEVESDTVKAVFSYDARNRCVVRQYYTPGTNGDMIPNDTASVIMTYDTDWNILSDHTLSGSWVADYIHSDAVDEILAQVRASGQVYPLSDALGSTLMLADQNGTSVGSYYYSVFGRLVGTVGDYRYLYTGREWLRLIGQNEHRNRYYSPNLGRWNSTDPLRHKADINLYRAFNNNPPNLHDAQGLFNDGQSGGPEADPSSPYRGHSDFYGSIDNGGCFDYTAEDHDPATKPTPGGNPALHFQNYGKSLGEVQAAIDSCRVDLFERAMHRLQDFYSHWKKGYRWQPCHFKYGHAVANLIAGLTGGLTPDQDDDAWKEAEAKTKELVDDFVGNCREALDNIDCSL